MNKQKMSDREALKILNFDRNVVITDQKEIDKNYRKTCLVYHPDKNQGATSAQNAHNTSMMIRLGLAKEKLTETLKRSQKATETARAKLAAREAENRARRQANRQTCPTPMPRPTAGVFPSAAFRNMTNPTPPRPQFQPPPNPPRPAQPPPTVNSDTCAPKGKGKGKGKDGSKGKGKDGGKGKGKDGGKGKGNTLDFSHPQAARPVKISIGRGNYFKNVARERSEHRERPSEAEPPQGHNAPASSSSGPHAHFAQRPGSAAFSSSANMPAPHAAGSSTDQLINKLKSKMTERAGPVQQNVAEASAAPPTPTPTITTKSSSSYPELNPKHAKDDLREPVNSIGPHQLPKAHPPAPSPPSPSREPVQPTSAHHSTGTRQQDKRIPSSATHVQRQSDGDPEPDLVSGISSTTACDRSASSTSVKDREKHTPPATTAPKKISIEAKDVLFSGNKGKQEEENGRVPPLKSPTNKITPAPPASPQPHRISTLRPQDSGGVMRAPNPSSRSEHGAPKETAAKEYDQASAAVLPKTPPGEYITRGTAGHGDTERRQRVTPASSSTSPVPGYPKLPASTATPKGPHAYYSRQNKAHLPMRNKIKKLMTTPKMSRSKTVTWRVADTLTRQKNVVSGHRDPSPKPQAVPNQAHQGGKSSCDEEVINLDTQPMPDDDLRESGDETSRAPARVEVVCSGSSSSSSSFSNRGKPNLPPAGAGDRASEAEMTGCPPRVDLTATDVLPPTTGEKIRPRSEDPSSNAEDAKRRKTSVAADQSSSSAAFLIDDSTVVPPASSDGMSVRDTDAERAEDTDAVSPGEGHVDGEYEHLPTRLKLDYVQKRFGLKNQYAVLIRASIVVLRQAGDRGLKKSKIFKGPECRWLSQLYHKLPLFEVFQKNSKDYVRLITPFRRSDVPQPSELTEVEEGGEKMDENMGIRTMPEGPTDLESPNLVQPNVIDLDAVSINSESHMEDLQDLRKDDIEDRLPEVAVPRIEKHHDWRADRIEIDISSSDD